jgi:hypothetical protein
MVVGPRGRRVHTGQTEVGLATDGRLSDHRFHQVLEDALLRPDLA